MARRIRTLSNNPTRGSNNWTNLIPGQSRSLTGLARRSVRRLMKVDPSNAQGTPDSQLLVGEAGIKGKQGASPVRIISGHTESKTTRFGGGKRVIGSDGVNRSLKKR